MDSASKLKRAVSTGDTTAVKRLIKGGVDINCATFWYDGSVLHEAVAAASPSVVRLLIDAKADVNARSKDGRTSLHVACRSGQEQIVDMLLEAKADVNAKTKDGRSPLLVALWRGHESISLKLIDLNADVRHKDEDGTTPLHWAAKTNLMTCVIELITAGAVVNATDKHGRTPLHEAIVSNGNRRLVSTLLCHGADPNISSKMANTTTLTLLLNHKECDVIKLVQLVLHVGYRITPRDRVTSRGAHVSSDVIDYMHGHDTRVATLAHLCRLTVRHCAVISCQGRGFVQNIDTLPLPVLLKDYLAFRADYSLM